MIAGVLKWLTGGALDRALGSVDKYIESTTDKEAIKADVVKSYYTNRASFMQSGGFILMSMFAVPLSAWYSAVIFYSMFLCEGCMYPAEWTIASLPPPLDQWSAAIIMSIFGVIGVTSLKR